jgi:energy-coupling factor transport system substrate-specific component
VGIYYVGLIGEIVRGVNMDWAGSKKKYQLVIFLVGCVLINYVGKELAVRCSLPLWFDAVGTVLAAYMMGPVWGALVGAAGNVIHGFFNPISFIYALTSMSIGICVGCFAKRRFLKSFFWTLSISVLVAGISTLISVILNVLFYNGMTSNMWGDGVIGFLKEQGCPSGLCYFIGEFYVDFLDKILTFLLLHFVFYIHRYGGEDKKNRKNKVEGVGILLAVSLIGAFISVTCIHINAMTEQVENSSADDIDIYKSGQNYTSYVQTIYNSNNGLPCGEANDIVQTKDGILWIGTYAGLYRYNGTEIRWADEYESIKNVNCLYVDEEGRLWIGTNDNGFSICENEEITNVIDDEAGLSSNSVRCIVQCSDGNYYIGTTSCMQVFSLEGELELLNNIEEVNYAVCVAADSSNHVVTIDTNGILYLLENQKVVTSLELNEGQEIFTTCSFDEAGVLYAGTSSNHIYTYDISSGSFVKKSTLSCGDLHDLNSIYFVDAGGMFICADNGVGYMDEQLSYTPVSTGQFNNSIDNMTVDYQGNLWFASSRLGLLRLCESGIVDYYSALGVESEVVNTSEFWNNMLYVGTDNGLDVLDIKNGRAVNNELTEKLSGIRIRCIEADSKNHLWICTYGSGLWEVDGDNITTYDTQNGTFGDRARVVIEMSDGMIVAAGDNCISFIDNGEIAYSFKYGTGLSNAMILSLMEMQDGGLMAGTDGDGIVIIRNGVVEKTITRADGLSSDVILRTVVDSAGDGAFVVTSNGLCYISADYTVQTLDNFPYFNNYDIWESSEGRLFVLGSAGIYVVDRDELLSGEEVDYDLLDAKTGLSTHLTVNSWNTCINGNYLYLSCDTGVYGINMLDTINNTTFYKMMLSSVKLDEISYKTNQTSKLDIGRDVNKIELFPEVINYTTEDPYVSYYLEGFDRTANVVLQSELGSIVYTNVPSGTYIFHLAVLGSDKETVLDEITYKLVKAKEIYDNSWFIVYMLLVLALFVSWFTWFVVHTHTRRTLKLQKKELELARKQVEMGNQTILAIAKTVDAKDENTSRHSQRVSEYSVMIARELGMDDEACEALRKTALLHDIGKIGIADSVLNKPGKLTAEEYEIMKSHVVKGAEILKDFTLVDNVWEGALYHHERYDGKGYTTGLKGEEIPLNARIIGIADAFDAMTANRVYRKKLNFEIVLEELKKGRGTQFDPQLVDIMLKLISEGKINVEELYADN